MSASSENCQCQIPSEMRLAGQALQLCQHSRPEDISQTQEGLFALIDDLAHRIPASEIYDKPLRQVAEEYMKMVVGHDFSLMNELEYNILMLNFLRFMSLSFQATMTNFAQQAQQDLSKTNPQRNINPFGRHRNRDIDYQQANAESTPNEKQE